MSYQRMLRCAAMSFAVLVLATGAGAQTQVYVLEQGTFFCQPSPCHRNPAVHLINSVTGHTLATIGVSGGEVGWSVRLSSDGRLLFVSDSSALTIIDTLTRQMVAQVPVPGAAFDVAILPDNSRAYVVNAGANSVSVVDLTSFTVVATIPVQSSPRRIVASPDGNSLYVTNSGSGTVSKISALTNTVAAHIPVGTGPHGLDISPDGSRLFVANAESNSVSVIDAGNDSVLRALVVGSRSTSQPMDVSAQSATRVYVALNDPFEFGGFDSRPLLLLNAADGTVIGSAATRGSGLARLARDSSGTPVFLVEDGLKRAATDGTSVTTVASGSWAAAAVVTDPCSFEATATAAVSGPSGGSGTLTIPAPAGCSWTIDPTGFGGISFTAPLSGTGAATRAFTVPSTSIPRLGSVGIRRQAITFEQTIPRMNVELASGGATLQEPFTITGWAIDQNAADPGSALTLTGVDQVHVWAYPAGGAAPILVGLASYGANRPDVASVFGSGLKYMPSGFSVVVRDLPSGSYTLAFFAHSTRSNTFSNVQTVDVTVRRAVTQIAIDLPAPGTIKGSFTVAGWAIDPAAANGPGIDAVHVWAYPATGAPPMFVGAAAYGGARPDAAAYVGSSFANCGYGLTASLPPGDYTLVVFARSTANGQFTSQTVRITVNP
jgi:YVTN family beta-propeller protein